MVKVSTYLRTFGCPKFTVLPKITFKRAVTRPTQVVWKQTLKLQLRAWTCTPYQVQERTEVRVLDTQSILYEEDQDLPIVDAEGARQTFPGMYMSKNIGPEGGSISIQGAKLTIPLGALTVSTSIRLGVVWKPNGAPPLGSQQALLSSVVACEPHGLQFDVPVNLEIQHCAQMRKDWELCIMRSNTSVRQGEFLVITARVRSTTPILVLGEEGGSGDPSQDQHMETPPPQPGPG